jgi:tRNA dimethylallyltransferase
MDKFLVVVLGPTAIGKTDIAIRIAKFLNSSIISADSRQIFKELSIGTAKPSAQQLQSVIHHFIDHKSIKDYYNASMFEIEVSEMLATLFDQHQFVVMAGGSGLYINAVCEGIDDLPTIDPELRKKLTKQYQVEGIEGLRRQVKMLDPVYYATADLRNYKRLLKAIEVSLMTGKPYSSFLTKEKKNRDFKIIKVGLNRDRAELHDIINQRVDLMIQEGLIKEARTLLPFKDLNALNTVGYRELFDYFDNKISYEQAVELIKRNTRRYARRQITWFRRDKSIRWFHPNNFTEILQYILEESNVSSALK